MRYGVPDDKAGQAGSTGALCSGREAVCGRRGVTVDGGSWVRYRERTGGGRKSKVQRRKGVQTESVRE